MKPSQGIGNFVELFDIAIRVPLKGSMAHRSNIDHKTVSPQPTSHWMN
jgi:hypothetical protein